jgi:hypothetical protein
MKGSTAVSGLVVAVKRLQVDGLGRAGVWEPVCVKKTRLGFGEGCPRRVGYVTRRWMFAQPFGFSTRFRRDGCERNQMQQ